MSRKSIDLYKTIDIVMSILVVLYKDNFMNDIVSPYKQSFWLMWTGLFILCGVLGMLGFFHLSADYHSFADQRSFWGISYGLNVLSNIAFCAVGLLACWNYYREGQRDTNLWMTAIGAIVVCIGSGYYHLEPNDYRLLWDRLPMSLVFSGIFCYGVTQLKLVPFWDKNKFSYGYLVFSIAAVVCWFMGTLININLLAPYVFLQFGGLILLCYMAMIAYREKEKSLTYKIIAILVIYALAKVTETYDSQIFEITNHFISGHTIKHLLSAMALYIWLLTGQNKK